MIYETNRKIARMMVQGTVAERDTAKRMVRFKVADEDGNPVLTNWVRSADANGAAKTSWLPSIGSQHLLLTPAGMDSIATYVPMGHHSNSPDPADGDQFVLFDNGSCRIEVNGDVITLKSGGTKIRIEGSGVHIDGGELMHNDKNVGSTHVHGGIETGGSDTLGPH